MKKSLITVLLLIGIIFTMSMVVFADTPDLSELLNNNNSSATANVNENVNANENLNVNSNTNTNTNTNTNVNANTNNQNTTPSKLADTGSSFHMVAFIAIATVAAAYAYKKVREYNV